jgi:hypothetical protein
VLDTVIRMNLAIAIIGAVAAIGAAVAAFGSWTSARKANDTAASLAAIEADRRHDELTPVFEMTCKVSDDNFALLRVTLVGGRLDQFDAVVVTVLDEAGRDHGPPRHVKVLGGPWTGPTEEEVRACVWGPVEFNANLPRKVVSNRESKPQAFSMLNGKNWAQFIMRPTRPPSWGNSSVSEWRERYEDQPVRLLLTCRRSGYPEPWFVQQDVPVSWNVPERTQSRLSRRGSEGS